MRRKKKHLYFILLQILLLVLFTLIIHYFNLDLKWQQHLYRGGQWYFAKSQPWDWLYHYGTYPATILSVFALVTFIFSYAVGKLVPLRKYALLAVLTIIIGPGILINGVFKDHWGRPRPRNVQEFGGNMDFREIWEYEIPGKGKSFPCGHSSMGYYFIVVYYFYKNRNKITAYGFLGGSAIYGTLIGIARMAQGGHFASDVLWSAGFTYITACVLYYFILKIPQHESETPIVQQSSIQYDKRKIIVTSLVSAMGVAILIWFFLFSRPLFKKYTHTIPSDLQFAAIDFSFQNSTGDVTITLNDFPQPVKIETTLQGFGYPKRKIKSRLNYNVQNDTLKINYLLLVEGIFYELEGTTQVELDATRPVTISGNAEKGKIYINNQAESLSSNITLKVKTYH